MAPTLTSEKSRYCISSRRPPLAGVFRYAAPHPASLFQRAGHLLHDRQKRTAGHRIYPEALRHKLWAMAASADALPPPERGRGARIRPSQNQDAFGYRDWVAVTVGSKDGKLAEQPTNIKLSKNNRSHSLSQNKQAADARIRVGGWAMNNMEAIAYLIAEEPLHLAKTPDQQQALDDLARHFSEAADQAVSQLLAALKKALFSGQKNASNDKGILDQARADFFDATEDQFHHLLDDLLQEMPEDGGFDQTAPARHWLGIMRRVALATFDRLAPVPLQDAEKAKTIVNAYGILNATFAGWTKQSKSLYDKLELPLPEKKSKTKKEAA